MYVYTDEKRIYIEIMIVVCLFFFDDIKSINVERTTNYSNYDGI